MTFQHGEKTFKIEFHRERREVKTFDEKGKEVFVLSKHPFTTAEIVELTEDKEKRVVLASASAGCSPEDKFTLESGRLRALKKVTDQLPREMRKVLWETYHSRGGTVEKKAQGGGQAPLSAAARAMLATFNSETPVLSQAIN